MGCPVSLFTVKNIRISTDILSRVFHILMELVPCRPTFLSVNGHNIEAWAHISVCSWASWFRWFTEPVPFKYQNSPQSIRRYTDVFTVLFVVYIITDAGSSQWVGRVISGACDCLCVSVLQKKNNFSYWHQSWYASSPWQALGVHWPWGPKVKVTWLSNALPAWYMLALDITASVSIIIITVVHCSSIDVQTHVDFRLNCNLWTYDLKANTCRALAVYLYRFDVNCSIRFFF